MNANVGDRIVVHGRHLAEHDRIGEIVEIHGPNGGPPYVVRWEGATETTVVVPGPDAHVEPRSAAAAE